MQSKMAAQQIVAAWWENYTECAQIIFEIVAWNHPGKNQDDSTKYGASGDMQQR